MVGFSWEHVSIIADIRFFNFLCFSRPAHGFPESDPIGADISDRHDPAADEFSVAPCVEHPAMPASFI